MKRLTVVLAGLLAFGLTISSCGPSAAQKAILETPTVNEVSGGLNNKLYWLKNNAQSGGNYVLEVNSPQYKIKVDNPWFTTWDLSYTGKNNITITIIGVGENQIVSRSEFGTIFNVGSGVTLVLENITIKGAKPVQTTDVYVYENITIYQPQTQTIDVSKMGPLIKVSSGGTLVMNEGSAIIDNQNNSGNGGGVHVSGGGTFLMKGGTISGNECYPVGNENTNVREQKFYGGGVYVAGEITLFGKTIPGGTFTKTGGTITGYTRQKDANVVAEYNAQGVSKNRGHAVYAGNKHREATAGPEVNLHFSKAESSGEWDE